MGHRGGGAVTLKAQLNVASQVVLTGGGSLAGHTKGGAGDVGGPHQLHLAEGAERRHHGPAHVLQDGRASGDQRGQVGVTSATSANTRRVRSVHAPVGGRQSQSTIRGVQEVNLSVERCHVDVVTDVSVVLLGVQHVGHFVYPGVRKEIRQTLPVDSLCFHIPR